MDLDCIKKKEQLEAKDISFGDRDFSEVDIKSMEVELEKKCSEIADLQKYLLEEFQNI